MMLLATDLDRTLLHNGPDPYDGSLPSLLDLVSRKKIALVYVSGRNLDLLEEAEKEYGIPVPEYLVAEVGTAVYKRTAEGKLERDLGWDGRVESRSPGWSRDKVAALVLERVGDLRLQEGWKQNPWKVSYYLDLASDPASVTRGVKEILKERGIEAAVLYSVDPLQNVGLLDILPKAANKATAIEYVRDALRIADEDVYYCGDSGNDILPLVAGWKAILVRNAPEEVKREVRDIMRSKGTEAILCVADGSVPGLNGNYSSGILEGLIRFGTIGREELGR